MTGIFQLNSNLTLQTKTKTTFYTNLADYDHGGSKNNYKIFRV